MTKEELALEVIARLKKEYPDAGCTLDYDCLLYTSCNQGNFHLIISRDGHGQVMRIMEPCEDTINIQTMTTMLMGYKRPEYLAKIGRIQAAEWTIDMLEDAIEQQTPYISDYF